MKRFHKSLIGAAALALGLAANAQQSWVPSKFGPPTNWAPPTT